MAETLVKKEPGEITAPEYTRGGTYYTPNVDIYEAPDEVVLQCDVPGVKPNDVDVRFEKGELILYGNVEPRQPAAQYLAFEYGIGDYYRAFAIGPEIDAGKISAECHEGVVTVHLPKQEKVKPRRIAVKAC